MLKSWFAQGIITNAAYAVLALTGGAAVGYLRLRGSEWASPVMYGLAGFVMTAIGILAIAATARLPKKRAVPDINNIESLVRAWLNNFRYGVKNNPVPTAYFSLTVTADSGIIMAVGRPKGEFEGYVLIRSDVTPTAIELASINALPSNDLNRILTEAKLELARAKVGYSGLILPLTTFSVFKRIPINEHLTEDMLIAKIEEIEAALLAVAAVYYMRVGIVPGGGNIIAKQADP